MIKKTIYPKTQRTTDLTTISLSDQNNVLATRQRLNNKKSQDTLCPD